MAEFNMDSITPETFYEIWRDKKEITISWLQLLWSADWEHLFKETSTKLEHWKELDIDDLDRIKEAYKFKIELLTQ
jgi:hypothetical protein